MPLNPELVAQLVQWGIEETDAQKALRSSVGQPARDKIDYAVAQIKPGGIDKPAGFIISTLRKERPVPSNFETPAGRQAREEAERRAAEERHRLEVSYSEYRKDEIDRYIAEDSTPEELADLTQKEAIECRRKYPNLPQVTIDEMVPRGVRFAIGERLGLFTFEEFCNRERQKPQSDSPAIAEA